MPQYRDEKEGLWKTSEELNGCFCISSAFYLEDRKNLGDILSSNPNYNLFSDRSIYVCRMLAIGYHILVNQIEKRETKFVVPQFWTSVSLSTIRKLRFYIFMYIFMIIFMIMIIFILGERIKLRFD